MYCQHVSKRQTAGTFVNRLITLSRSALAATNWTAPTFGALSEFTIHNPIFL